ncbi:cytochrome P450 [Trifolium medium]|uniref:Cytochrome P450 n=1 Tax=Trifolium medium TaxID=97028 RepID=A0A392N0C6_9FABA|nr:cytochrome P450 [Trifolium medium]
MISECQSAFLPNRQILDGVLVVNELIDLAKRRKDKCMMFKVDFERAYDTSSMSVLVNGSPTDEFIVGKGLRQGDPLSPFLFLIAAEGLTKLIQRAVDIGSFLGYKVSNDIQFHILQFADDTVIVGEGLKVNFFKSKLYGINLEEHFMAAASAFLHCGVDFIPFRFL